MAGRRTRPRPWDTGQSQDYYDCRDLFKQLLAEGLPAARIVKESGISIELAKRCVADLGVQLGPPSAAAASANAASTAAPLSRSTPATAAATKKEPAIADPPKKTIKAKPWRCPQWPKCDKHYSTKQGLDYHLEEGKCTAKKGTASKAAADTEGKMKCSNGCRKEYKSQSGLDYHLTEGKCDARNGFSVASSNQSSHICKVPACTYRFNTVAGLTHHLNNAHGALGQEMAKAMH
ncbi:hypothetical protein V8E36_007467 [Tilletia maclaganii]